MRLSFAVPLTAAGLAGAVPAAAQRPLPSDSVVRAIVRERVDDGRYAGIAIGLIDADGRTRTVAYGPRAGVTPFDDHTVFEIGSITKTFTAAILADMVRSQAVRLDQPVAELLPAGTVVPRRGGRQITLADLATQSSGLPRMPDNFAPRDPNNPYADYDGTRLLAFLARYELPRDIGAQYEYSNLGVGLLGYALAAKAGVSYERLVTDRVLRPLGMTETVVTLTPALRARLAPGHDPAGAVVANWDLDALAGAGAIRSTVHDMLRYLGANIDPGASSLGPALATTHDTRFQTTQPTLSIGLAWHRLATPRGDTIVWHNGGTGGYRTFTGFDPKRRVGVVVLANTATSVDDIGIHLLDESLPLAKPPAARTEVTLPADALQRFVGEYRLAPNFAITVARTGDVLTAQGTDQPAFRLFAEAPTKFFLKSVDAQIEFEVDAAGVPTALILVQGGARQRAPRVGGPAVPPGASEPAPPPGQSRAAAAVRALDSAWARSYATHDTALAGKLFADDLIVTSSSGTLRDKAGELGDVGPAPGLVMEYFRTEDVAVRVYGAAAVVNGVASWRFTMNGRANALRRRYTATYIQGGPLGWRMVAIQLGPAPA
jgi:serine-type D-Ala-D-Ala carboxypeptidase/endopeptidase